MRHHNGQVEVICGSMFSGKTEELIRRIRRAIIAQQEVQVFKPALDDRSGVQLVSSHTGQNVEAQPVDRPAAIMEMLGEETTVVAIDEVQFYDETLIDIVEQLASKSIRVILAGLDMDFRGEPFGPMPQLMCRAEEVTKLHAICVVCGDLASRTQRLVNDEPAHYDDPIILVGASESYEARCRKHHEVRR